MPGPENRAGSPPEEEWPDPTVEEPELADLEGWEAEGGCEATDGCWVSVEGGLPARASELAALAGALLMAVSKRQIMSVRDWARTVSLHTSSRRQYLSSLGAPPGPVQAELRLLEASCERLVRLVDAGHRA